MSTLRSSLAERVPRLPRNNSSPKAVPPSYWRLAAASVTAVIVSLVADIVLEEIGRAALTVPAAFSKLSFGSYAPLTVLGIAGATAAWWAVARISSRPQWLLTRLAVLVTALLLIPDVLLLGMAGNPAGPVAFLMLMHLAIGAVTYTALVKISPARTGAP